MMQGSVKFFNTDKGFGFIVPADGSQDVFFHVTQCEEGYEPQDGDEVTFELGQGRDGRSAAVNVQLTNGGSSATGDDYSDDQQDEQE